MEVIDIALAADSGYFCGLFVTACSIAKYAAKDVTLRFNILDGGIDESDLTLLKEKVCKFHPSTEIRCFEITGELFKDCLLWHGNHMTYARLLLPDLMKDDDYCIYCDVDFLWMRDISELWAERREDIALISTWDGTKSTWDVDGTWLRAHGFDFSPDDYFCAGLAFFNLKYFRAHNLHKKCFDLLKLKPPFNDQTVMYIATKGHSKLVSQIWQRFPERVTQAELNTGCVVHHAGELPWKRVRGFVTLLSDTIMLWHRFNAEILGISVWQSLRRYNPSVGILYHRTLFWLMRCPFVAWPLKFVCNLLRHPGVYGFLECRAKRLRI